MDHQFDVLTRIFATCTSRRQAIALLAAMTAVGSRPGVLRPHRPMPRPVRPASPTAQAPAPASISNPT